MKIIFTSNADEEYTYILQYLYENFGIEKVISFDDKLKYKVKQIKSQPYSFGYFFDTKYRNSFVQYILF